MNALPYQNSSWCPDNEPEHPLRTPEVVEMHDLYSQALGPKVPAEPTSEPAPVPIQEPDIEEDGDDWDDGNPDEEEDDY